MLKHGLSGRHALSKNGFTLIELVAVIVILGILSASASTKYMSLQSDARIAVLKNMQGNIKSANSMVLAKALINNSNSSYSDEEDKSKNPNAWKKDDGKEKTWDEVVKDCSQGNCVNVGDMWIYLKYAYVDRNSVAFIVNADISGLKTEEVTNSATKKKMTVPKRDTKLGDVNYRCTSAGEAKCEGHDFCQCRGDVKDKKGNSRDSEFIIPKGFYYNYTKHKTNYGGGCYFAYSSAKYIGKTAYPPVYTLETGGC